MTCRIHTLDQSQAPLNSPSCKFDRPPRTLFVLGDSGALPLLERVPHDALAVVGTRKPQARTVEQVRTVISWLAGTRLMIVSGLARGIDSAAHEAALAAGLPTIGVVAGGVDVVYPPESASLRQRIIEKGGLIISEWPPGTPPIPGYFIERNRLIAGWSNAVWVAEAGVRSGALNTARWARDQHRTVFSTPCFPCDPALAGNQQLLDDHAAVPLWAGHSLGFTWLELAARADPGHKRSRKRPWTADERALAREVETDSLANGGARVDALFDWASSLGWSPIRFFETLQTALDGGLLLDRNGHLLKNPALSV